MAVANSQSTISNNMGNSLDVAYVPYRTALACIKLTKDASILDLTTDEYAFLTGSALWLPTDRSRARRAVEAAVYGALDYVGFPRFPAPAEFIAAVIATYVQPVNVMSACAIMDGCEFSEHIILGVERKVSARELFAHVCVILGGNTENLERVETVLRDSLGASNG